MKEKQNYNLRRTGMQFEQIAGTYLEKCGYRIRQYNFRSRFGEIDIVAEEGGNLVFCEVKFRSGSGNGHPEEAVDLKKQWRISRTALFYLHRFGYDPYETPCRFDVISIEGQAITLYKDAFPFAGNL